MNIFKNSSFQFSSLIFIPTFKIIVKFIITISKVLQSRTMNLRLRAKECRLNNLLYNLFIIIVDLINKIILEREGYQPQATGKSVILKSLFDMLLVLKLAH